MSEVVGVYAPGHLDPYDSYGLIGCELVRHISNLDVHVNAISLGNSMHPNQDAEVAALTEKPLRMSVGGILLGYPTSYPKLSSLAQMGTRIGVTMFESTILPKGWVDALNTLDAVVVPCEFCHDIFVENGVVVPIKVIPLGIRPVYKPKARRYNDKFRFLTFLDRGRRKGGLAALDAFSREFWNDDSVELVIKTKAAGTQKLELKNHNIKVIQKDMTEKELYNLYVSCHCLVNPNKGEGFGLIPREFAATGGISLATNWGGTADHIDQWGWPLPYTVQKADWSGYKNLEDQYLGDWAEPDIDGVAAVMRNTVNSRDILIDIAYDQAPKVAHMYSWKTFAEQVYILWKELTHANSGSATMVAG